MVGYDSFSVYLEETGVLQGSVLAVTLFLVAMKGIYEYLPANLYVFIYADDILLVAVANTPGSARIKAQAAVNAVARWTEAMGFTLTAAKSVRGYVCRFRHQLGSPAININGSPIPNNKPSRSLEFPSTETSNSTSISAR